MANATFYRAAIAIGVFTFVLYLTTEAYAKRPKIDIAVTVNSEDAKGISGAAISIKSLERTYTGTTGPDGKASIAVPFIPRAEYWVTASKRGYESKDRLVLLGTTLDSGPAEAPITLKKKAGEDEPVKVTIAVSVNGDDGKGISSVAIALKGPQGTYTGTTDSAGKTSITVPFIPKAEYWVSATKRDYEGNDRMVLLGPTLESDTVDAPPITMKKGAPRAGIIVRFKVTKQGSTIPVREAHIKVRDMSKIVSDDYYVTTNQEGIVAFRLPGPGTYPLSVTQGAFESYEGQIQLTAGEETKNIDIALKEIASDKTVTVTVLAGDVKNGKGGNEPIRGATVTGGQGSGNTDSKGIATFAVRPFAVDAGDALGWQEKVEVTVSASGYKSQTKTVQLKQQRIGQPWTANETFLMEAGEDKASDDTPIKVVVEVRDPRGLLPVADVTLASLGSGQTDSKGERLFDSGKRSAEELARLRKGIAIKVTRQNHETYDKTIPADLLQPSNEPRRYSVQLDLDWHDLKPALTSLEKEVAEWKGAAESITQKANAIEALTKKVATSKTRVEVILADLKRKRKDADTKLSEGPCKEAKELNDSISSLMITGGAKEKELRSALDEAIKLAANCKAKGDGDIIRAKHKSAIVLAGELGKLEKQVREKSLKLTKLAQSPTNDSPVSEFQKSIEKIDSELTAVGKDAAAADNNLTNLETSSKGLPGRRAELLQKLNYLWGEHWIRDYEAFLPPDLSKRLKAVEDSLTSRDGDLSMASAPSIDRKGYNVIKQTVEQLQKYKNEAVEILESYKQAACDIKPDDEAGEVIGRAVVGATIELGAAGDLSKKAADCDAAVAAADNQVTVPDLSVLNDLGAMKRVANQAGLVFQPVPTNQTPPSGSQRLFGPQAPPAFSKAQRGSRLTIPVYQKLTPTPTPTSTAAVKTPTPTPADEYVDVPSVSSAVSIESAGIILRQAGFVPVFKAQKPEKKEQELKFAGQDPVGRVKKSEMQERGNKVYVFVYQKFEGSTATPSASPTATAAVAKTGNMPNLIGLTLDRAVNRLTSNMRIGSDEIGDKPPSPELALTIFSQVPAPGASVDMSKPVVISVKRYGSAKTEKSDTGSDPFLGTWVGTSPYSDAAITISKQSGQHQILAQGHTASYPATSDGTTLSNDFGIYKITMVRVGDSLEGTARYTDYKGAVHTKQFTLNRN